MTPTEKVIAKWYSVNSFMFNRNDENYYDRNLKDEVILNIRQELSVSKQHLSIQEVKEKFKYLRDVFVKAHAKVINKEDLTYVEKCIFERMSFLKPHISHKADHKEPSKYESTSSIKLKESVKNASICETKDYLSNIKDNGVIQMNASILNDIIKSFQDKEKQRLCLLFILKRIENFRKCNGNVKVN